MFKQFAADERATRDLIEMKMPQPVARVCA